MRRVADAAFWVAAAVLVGAQLLVLWQSLVENRLWEDEAFNLTVPLNLLAGNGYTSDGTLSGSTLTPFDPRISTGPVVLLPIAAVLATGADLVVGGRLVPAAFYLALLAALWVLGRRIGGRWAGLLAVTVPLAFDASAPPSAIQGPADVLGEVPAASLIAWALVFVQRRPWLAGLLFGLAIQSKYISLLAAPALVVALLLSLPGESLLRRLRAAVIAGILALVPTIVVELAALIALGPAGFVQHLRDTVRFVRTGGQPGVATTVAEKLSTLAASWHLPGALALATAVVVVLLIVTAVVVALRSPRSAALALSGAEPVRRTAPLLAGAAVGVLTYVGWWATAGHLPLWVRHPAPGLLAFVPVLFAFVVPAIGVLWRAGEQRRSMSAAAATATAPALRAQATKGVLVVVAVFVAVVTTAQVTAAAAVALTSDGASLAQQRRIAGQMAAADADWIATQWGGAVSLVVLSGAHVALTDAPPANIAGYPVLSQDAAACEVPLASAPPFVVCAP
ncbi:glycosyltransferase family 39 protein [Microbacterium sp. zg.Y909]|uniref:glycosyltransferase family 39 protein n=1 Tax=Microbacterium sp. zg.Y909 TaxID=2969413 RepID=UPI00214B56B9|nr:glycosyltransferase family 39 protein [Microbacterium sp. zg.Y909]MCR2823943.1 glycosyltransferase family 39 protein [Microbacterium sp. zg.Y909]